MIYHATLGMHYNKKNILIYCVFHNKMVSFVTFVQRSVFFFTSGSRRFEVLSFSLSTLTPTIFLCYVRGIFVFFC
ncbi:hypothetical protein Hanom_Chr16g01507131 [Helianthus anomalus]